MWDVTNNWVGLKIGWTIDSIDSSSFIVQIQVATTGMTKQSYGSNIDAMIGKTGGIAGFVMICTLSLETKSWNATMLVDTFVTKTRLGVPGYPRMLTFSVWQHIPPSAIPDRGFLKWGYSQLDCLYIYNGKSY